MITVSVDRNKNAPQLIAEDSNHITINENTAPGSEVFRLQISDADKVVSFISFVSCLPLANYKIPQLSCVCVCVC